MEVALVHEATGIVVTVVDAPSPEVYASGSGLIAVDADGATAYAGCTWTEAGGFVEPQVEPPTQAELIALKSSLKVMIDHAAEAERLKYITAGAGQAMTYTRKVEEARAATAEADPAPSDYPLLAASIGIDGPDVAAVATVVLGMDAAWAQIGAAIEAVRLGTKKGDR